MRLYTIGFTGKSAEEFFETLKEHRVKRLVDVRLRPDSHLAGFARAKHLIYFLREICAATYEHYSALAPTEDMLKGFRDGELTWDAYRAMYLRDLGCRIQGQAVEMEDGSCLLCSESSADRCHRSLAAEFVAERCSEIEVFHL